MRASLLAVAKYIYILDKRRLFGSGRLLGHLRHQTLLRFSKKLN